MMLKSILCFSKTHWPAPILDIGANETFCSIRLVASRVARIIGNSMPIIKRGYSISYVHFPRRDRGANIII